MADFTVKPAREVHYVCNCPICNKQSRVIYDDEHPEELEVSDDYKTCGHWAGVMNGRMLYNVGE